MCIKSIGAARVEWIGEACVEWIGGARVEWIGEACVEWIGQIAAQTIDRSFPIHCHSLFKGVYVHIKTYIDIKYLVFISSLGSRILDSLLLA